MQPSGSAYAEAVWLSELHACLCFGIKYTDEDFFHGKILLWPVHPEKEECMCLHLMETSKSEFAVPWWR